MNDVAFVPDAITPSAEQRAIQMRRARYLLVQANAGAAKTTTLALRIGQALLRGAPPESILVLTCTEPAVLALHRQLALVGIEPDVLRLLRVQTFESFSLAALQHFEGGEARVEISRERVKPYVIRAIGRAQTLPHERYPEDLASASTASELVEGLLRSFDYIKGRMLVERLDEDECMTPALAQDLGLDYFTMRVRSCYEHLRRDAHPDLPEFRFSGDGCYDLARKLASGEVDARDGLLRLNLSLVCVDEMHDLNRVAFEVLKAVLAANPRAAFVGVGDRDQVIHSQTGAEAGFMAEHFEHEIGVAEVLPLTTTRRFSPALAGHAGALARKPYSADPELRTDIVLEACATARVTAELVAQLAAQHRDQDALGNLRVLLRHPSQSVLIEHALQKLTVPYSCDGFSPYLERPEILLVRGLYLYARGDSYGFEDHASRVRLLEAMLFYAGAKIDSLELRNRDATEAQRIAVNQGAVSAESTRTFIEAHVLRSATQFARLRLLAAIQNLQADDADRFGAGFMSDLDPKALASRVLVRKEDILQVRDNVHAFFRTVVDEGLSVDRAFRMISDMDVTRRRAVMAARRSRVVLSSIEASKGLEFDHVVIPGLSQGEFAGPGVDRAQERNLLYVAMTRARRRLTLCFDPDRPATLLRDAQFLE